MPAPTRERQGEDIAAGESEAGMRLWHLVLRRAEHSPAHTLLSDDRGRAITSAGLRDAAEQVAAGLHELGVREGTRVAWQLPSILESLVLATALARLGAVQNPVITNFRDGELEALRDQFWPELAVVPTRWRGFEHAEAARRIYGSGTRVLICDHADAAPGLALPEGDPASLPALPPEDGVRWVFTTSGSTSAPKGVLHTDAGIFASANGSVLPEFGLGSDDVFPIAFPTAHIGGLSWLVAALRSGLRLHLLDKFDPETSPAAMTDATILGSALPMFAALRAAQAAHGSEPLFPRLRLCMAGGAPLPSGLDKALREELGGGGLINGYALTEFPIAGKPPVDDPAARAAAAWRPAPRVEVRIVDAEGREVPDGQPGEVRLRGPQQFHGYLGSADTTLDDQGFVCTGDVGCRDERGLITITGRVKEIVIRNGENISLAEVEGVVVGHPSVADVAVVGLPDERTGERCCAAIVLAPGAPEISLAELGQHCGQAGLARYKTPEQLHFLDVIPRNAMGKIRRNEVVQAITTAPGAS